jgi:hypothetical protein
MMKIRLSRKGQNMAEYAIIFGIVIAAAVGISALIKEGIQDRVTAEVRKLGDDGAAGTATFDISASTTRSSSGNETTTMAKGGKVDESKNSSGSTTVSESYKAGK